MQPTLGRIALLGLALLLGAAAAVSADDIEANKELVRRMTDLINRRDFVALEAVLAPDLRRHSGATPHLTIESREQFIEFLHQDVAAVPDSHQEIDFMLAEGDLVAARVIYSGTQTGPWGPFPPSGEHLELPFIGILRIDDGRIAEIWVEWNNLWALEQLGHFPPSSAEEGTEPPGTGS